MNCLSNLIKALFKNHVFRSNIKISRLVYYYITLWLINYSYICEISNT